MASWHRLGPRAEDDLDAIWLYLLAVSERVADTTIDRITATFDMLTENPLAGQRRTDVSANLRSFPVDVFMIFYVVEQDGIQIVRVMHGRRNITRGDLT